MKQKKGITQTPKGKERRSFLKKALYSAPTLLVLEELSRPKQAKADFGPPPSDPGWG